MKILLVNKYHYLKGGAETYYFTLGKILEKAGHTVIYFSMSSSENLPCKQENYFVSHKEYVNKTTFIEKIKAFNTLIYSKEAYNKITKLIENEKPDLAILSNIHRQLTTSIIDALYEHKIKIYWVVHDLILLCPNYTMLNNKFEICEKCCGGKYFNCVKNKCVKNSYLKSFLGYREAKYNKKRNIVKKIDLFITPSNFYRDKMIEYGFEPNKIKYIPNPIEITKNILINNDGSYCLYFGRLSREKGIKTLIRACLETDTELLILGKGPLENELKELVGKSGKTNIKFGGFASGNALEKYIHDSKIVALPSEWYENGPYSAMEAMNLGKPLLVSNKGGLPELVDNNINGYIFNSYEELLKILESLNKNGIDPLMGFNSYKKAFSMFNADDYVEKIFTDFGLDGVNE